MPYVVMPDDIATVTAVLTKADGWSVDRHIDYDGALMIVAVHDLSGLTFVLSGPANDIKLARVQDDKMTSVGTFTCMDAALDAALREAPKR